MPEEFRAFGASWLEHNPGWTMQEWSETDLEGWIQNRALWDAAPALMPSRLVHRFRSNLARLEVLHRHGGVYVDTDFEALGPLEPHLRGLSFFGVEEKEGLLASGVIGSVPGHPLLKHAIDDMPASVTDRPGQPSWKSNGQLHLQRTAQKYGGLELLPTRLFYPYHHSEFSRSGQRPAETGDAVAHHVWASRRKSVSVIVPWRDPDPDRLRAWEWVSGRLAEHPDWQIVRVSDGLDGPFSRARAIVNGVRESFGDVIVVSDSDVWCDALPTAIEAVRSGAKWAVPHGKVHRLTAKATQRVLAGETFDDILSATSSHTERPYFGRPCGGLVVLPRATFERVPPDPQFVGWGGEDDAWAPALDTLVGRAVRFSLPLVHLWHPPQQRVSRSVGSAESLKLVQQYRKARGNPRRMAKLVDAAKASIKELEGAGA